MDSVFLVQLALSFVVGSVWILLTVFLADRFGSKIGGFIGGLPSTAAVSFFFIGLTQSTEIAAQATTVFPLSYAFTGLFLVLYALFWRRGFTFTFGVSISVWFFLSACVRWHFLCISRCFYIGFGHQLQIERYGIFPGDDQAASCDGYDIHFYVWSWSAVFLSFIRIVVGDTRGLCLCHDRRPLILLFYTKKAHLKFHLGISERVRDFMIVSIFLTISG